MERQESFLLKEKIYFGMEDATKVVKQCKYYQLKCRGLQKRNNTVYSRKTGDQHDTGGWLQLRKEISK